MSIIQEDGSILATIEELRNAPLPPDVEMRVESIISQSRRHGKSILLTHGDGLLQLNDRDYAAVKEGLRFDDE